MPSENVFAEDPEESPWPRDSQESSDEQLRAAVLVLDQAAATPQTSVELDKHTLQTLLGAATRVFAARREAGEDLEPFTAAGPSPAPTATDVVVTVSAMLDSASIELIEVGLWQTWGYTAPTRRERHG